MAGTAAVIQPWQVNQATAAAPASPSLQSDNGLSGVNQGGYALPSQAAPTGAVLGASTTDSGVNAAQAAQVTADNAAIDSQLARLPVQQQVGTNNILGAYNSAFNTLTNQQGQDTQAYDTSKTQDQQDNTTAKDNIDTGVRDTTTALQRLFGSRGAGDSSASDILGPYAAALQGNTQRGAVNQAFDRNQNALDTNFNNTNQNFSNAFGQLGTQRDSQLSSLQAGLDTAKAQLLAARNAGNPDPATETQIQALQSTIDQLGSSPTFAPPVVNYATPTLNSYAYSTSAAPTTANPSQAQIAQNTGPFFGLIGQQQQNNQLVGSSPILTGATS